MARVTYSPLIVEMSGKCADAVFSRWKGIDYVRSRVTPANPRSDLQTAQRDALKHTLTMWQSVKGWAKAVWDKYAKGYALSGYNRYMDDNILHVKAAEAGHLTPYNPDRAALIDAAAVAGGAGIITASWTARTGAGGSDYVDCWYRKSETESEEYAWTFHGQVMESAATYSYSALDTGEEYEVAFTGVNISTGEYCESFNKVLLAG